MRHKVEMKVYDTIEATEDLSRRGYSVKIVKLPETLMEQIQQLIWRKIERRATKSAFNTGRDTSYKRKLRAFRRTSLGPSAD